MANLEPSEHDARAVLGVTATATPAQVVTAFRHRARTVHPDVSHTLDAAEQFSALVAAYRVALRAARAEARSRPGFGAGGVVSASPDPPRARLAEVVAGSGATAIWEAGRLVLLVAPAMAHPPTVRADGDLEKRRH